MEKLTHFLGNHKMSENSRKFCKIKVQVLNFCYLFSFSFLCVYLYFSFSVSVSLSLSFCVWGVYGRGFNLKALSFELLMTCSYWVRKILSPGQIWFWTSSIQCSIWCIICEALLKMTGHKFSIHQRELMASDCCTNFNINVLHSISCWFGILLNTSRPGH